MAKVKVVTIIAINDEREVEAEDIHEACDRAEAKVKAEIEQGIDKDYLREVKSKGGTVEISAYPA